MTPKIYTGTPAQGLWTMPAHTYHADPCPTPSLSSGCIETILDRSPLHAWNEHPRYGNNRGESERRHERGSVVHKLVLDAGAEVQVIEAEDYKTKAAREQRGEIEARGLLPCLRPEYEAAQACSGIIQEALEDFLKLKVRECLREVVVLWQAKGGGWRRARYDLLTPDLLIPVDLKSTQGSAAPAPSQMRIFDQGYHLQAAHYLDGLDAIDPANRGRRPFTFLFGESEPPFAVSPPIQLTEGALTLARQQCEVAGALYDSCVKADQWPGYDPEPVLAEPPPWFIARWELRMNGDHTLNPLPAP